MNLLPNIRTRVPLISVGNLEVGGTGKTPILAKLASMLNGLGYQPGLLTGLGEGGSSGILNLGDAILDTESPDEAQMLARRFPDLAVIAARPKWKGAKTLDAQRVCDVILLDDGFQHQRLARDIDLVLISGSVPLTSNQVLPAGPLREFPSALKRADAFLLPELVDLPEELPDRPVFRFRTLNTGLFELGGEKAETSGRPFMVISAIARPGRFEDASSHWGEIALRLRFRDHAPWSIEIRDSIAEAMEEYPDCQPLLTEKDAARWGASWDLPGPPPLYLDLQIDWEDPQALLDWLDSRLKSC
jgi:tetraacyldisaccharide 4'-kinase